MLVSKLRNNMKHKFNQRIYAFKSAMLMLLGYQKDE